MFLPGLSAFGPMPLPRPGVILRRGLVPCQGTGVPSGRDFATASRRYEEASGVPSRYLRGSNCRSRDRCACRCHARERACFDAGLDPVLVAGWISAKNRDRVIASLTKYEIDFVEDAETDELRNKLAAFYAKRSLTQSPIDPDDQAEAIFLLVSQRLSKTTGHVIPVDGGLADGFMR